MNNNDAQLKAATSDLASLSRVEHKLALTEASNLERVLNLLLPRLLSRIGSNHVNQMTHKNDKQLQEVYKKIQTKLVSMLSHTMKRVRSDPNCKLPCYDILKLLADPEKNENNDDDSNDVILKYRSTIDPFTLNLALTFLTLGIPRCDVVEEIPILLHGILVVFTSHTGVSSLAFESRKLQASQVAHLVLQILERITETEVSTSQKRKKESTAITAINLARKLLSTQPLVSQALFDLLLDVLLYQPTTSKSIPPSGLSQAGHERLIRGSSTTSPDWACEMAATSRLRGLKLALLALIAPTRRWSLFMGGTDMGTCQTIVLLVAASGDVHMDVASGASSYLKAYLDNLRSTKSSSDESDDKEENNFHNIDIPNAVIINLLHLVLGGANAEAAIDKLKTKAQILSLGAPSEIYQPNEHQIALSLKRRMAAEKTNAVILSFCAKLLDETPYALLDLSNAIAVGTLSILCGKKLLTTFTSGLSATRASVYISASKLLNALCIRLAASPSVVDNADIHALFTEALSAVCAALSHVTSHSASRDANEGSITVRDACYGVICTLSRCAEYRDTGRIFGLSSTSIDTAKLLFACATNEAETLRPRAVAALDALLGAYVQVYTNQLPQVAVDSVVKMDTNPWAAEAVTDIAFQPSTSSERHLLAKSLLPLLWSAAQSSKSKASRVSASRWSRELLKLLDKPNAFHLLCYLAGDADVTAAGIARSGLGLERKVGDTLNSAAPDMTLPDFGDISRVLFTETDSGAETPRPRYLDFNFNGKAATLRFGLNCFLGDLYGGEDIAVQVYIEALCETLRQFGSAKGGKIVLQSRTSVDLLDECAICLSGCVSTSPFARSLLIRNKTAATLEDLKFLTIHVESSKARRYLAESIGHLYLDYELWVTTSTEPLQEWVNSCSVLETLKICSSKIAEAEKAVFITGEAHGSAFLASWAIRSLRFMLTLQDEIKELNEVGQCVESAGTILAMLSRGTDHDDEMIGNAFSNSIEIALSYDSIDAPVLDERLYAGISETLANLDLALLKNLNGDKTDPIRAACLIKAAGTTLAASTSAAGYVSDTIKIGQTRLQCMGALFKAIGSEAFRKNNEVALAAGEALAKYADAYSPQNATWSNKMNTRPDEFDENFLNELPPHEQVIYALLSRDLLASSPHTRTAVAPALMAIVAHATKSLNRNILLIDRALVQELISKLSEIQAAFLSILADPKCKQLARESCCLGLAACQGLANAISINTTSRGSEDVISLRESLNDHLLRAFGQTTNREKSAMMESREQNEERLRQERRENSAEEASSNAPDGFDVDVTEVGGAAGLGEAALGAYREMAAAAVALGRSDVLYTLLFLSVSHPVWKTRNSLDKYSALSILGEQSLIGSGTSVIEIREALRPHIGKLIPRLLRAKHDPNKQTREQMETLWLSLTGGGAEARKAITENLLSTIDTLIDDAGKKLWRARVGACGALAEVIVGRSWVDLGGGNALLEDDEIIIKTSSSATKAAVRLLRLWRVAVRAIDDIRLPVRESGGALARSVRSLTVRLCDPKAALSSVDFLLASSSERRSAEEATKAASATSLRWLIQHGIDQPCAEVVGVSISCLIGIVEVVRPETLEQVLPELIGSLLMAISGLEPAAINYLQVRAAGSSSSESYDRLEQARLQAMQSGPITKALTKCLDMIPQVELKTQQAIVPQLDSALRGGAGFATRAATADSVSSLCHSCPSTFNKFHGTSSTNPTVRLLRALYFASEKERGVGAKDKMSHALGNLASLSPGQSVRSLVLKACNRYTSATGSNEDPAVRRSAAAAVRAVVVRAGNQLSDGGPNDIWSTRVLPIAFLGQKDKEKKIASLWRETWEEGGTSLGMGKKKGFGVLIEEQILPGIVNACVQALNDVSWARRVAGATSISELCEKNILSPIARSIDDSKIPSADFDRAKRRAEASCTALKACVTLMIRPRIWTGKNDIVLAAVSLAGKWASSEKPSLVLGWKGVPSQCPWLPINVSVGNNKLDLFIGDQFFQNVSSSITESEVNPDTSYNKEPQIKSEESVFIDFVEGDKILESNSDTEDLRVEEQVPSTTVSFQGLCRLLLDLALPLVQTKGDITSHDDVLPFRATALQGLADLLRPLHDKSVENCLHSDLLKEIYDMTAYRLLSVFDFDALIIDETDKLVDQPPLIVARSIQCFSVAIWGGIGCSEKALENISNLATIIHNSFKKQGAWTVREAAILCASSIANVARVDTLRSHKLLALFIECAKDALKDRKFWRLRFAGLSLLRSLMRRAGTGNSNIRDMHASVTGSISNRDDQIMLEAILPFKEDIVRQARSSLSDTQPEVTALASEICGMVSWWS